MAPIGVTLGSRPVVAVLLGLAASASFACARLSLAAWRSVRRVASVLANQVVGLLPLSVYLVLLHDQYPTGRDIAISMAAGLVSILGLGLLFGGFAVGRMAVVAPVSAGVGGVVPIAWGLLRGERPSTLAFLGAVVTLTAAIVLARSEAVGADESIESPDDRKATIMAIGAGVAFGVILILFSETGSDVGLWPPFVAHLVAIPTLTVGLLVAGRTSARPRMPAG